MTNKAGLTELISFIVADREFCVDVMAVREIRGWMPATPLPHTPTYVRGVIDLRGAVLTVVDLAARLGLGPTEPTARHVIIVTHIGAQLIGLLVDAVSDILTVDAGSIQPSPEIAVETARYVRGLLAIDGRMISVIALENLIELPERAAA